MRELRHELGRNSNRPSVGMGQTSMSCPQEIADVIIQILRDGILRIRARAWADDVEACAVESDHLHNLPALLRSYRPELLDYYLDVERPAYLAMGTAHGYEALWNRLLVLRSTGTR